MCRKEGRKVFQMVLKFVQEKRRFSNVMWFSKRQKQDFTVDDGADKLEVR